MKYILKYPLETRERKQEKETLLAESIFENV